MNKLNPKKLRGSKWTAVKPIGKAKHFLISDVEYDEDGAITHCEIEAIVTKRRKTIDWRSLADSDSWKMGWR